MVFYFTVVFHHIVIFLVFILILILIFNTAFQFIYLIFGVTSISSLFL